MAGEFDLIARYFAPLAGPSGLGLLDDAACIRPLAGKDLIISKDMLVEDIHFLPNSDPVDLAFKALSVNISDLAAKGATSSEYFLGLALPRETPADWFEGFSRGLAEAQAHYGVQLAGGDTTSTSGGIVISVTALGYVDEGHMITRAGAKAGDRVYVTGILGSAALGLRCLQGHDEYDEILVNSYLRPVPHHEFGRGLVGLATAAADVSDGFLADLGHICAASGVGATILQDRLPLSTAAMTAVEADPALMPLIWSGGDDYEIVFTASAAKVKQLEALSAETGTCFTDVGVVKGGSAVELIDSFGKLVHLGITGFQHF